MAKLLVFLLVLAGIFLLIRASSRKGETSIRASRKPATPEAMVRCAHCGVYLPDTEAISEAELHYCSEDHRRLGEHP